MVMFPKAAAITGKAVLESTPSLFVRVLACERSFLKRLMKLEQILDSSCCEFVLTRSIAI
jgi:hypothetical protein